MNGLWGIVVALLTVSFMWPSEGAINGDGLHWAVLWLVCAAFGCWQNRDRNRGLASGGFRELMDGRWAVLVIVIGVWASVGYVFRVEGDRRAALNVAFEWTSIFAASVVFWQMSMSVFRRQMGRVLIGLGLGMAAMGVIQHHVVWEQRANWYLERVATIDAGQQQRGGVIEAAEAEAELRASGVPLEGAAEETFRRRLLDSTEAIGPFALANSLGGFLAAVLVLLLAAIWNGLKPRADHQVPWGSVIVPFGWAIVIGYSLVLTKSRTAWVAVAAGAFWYLVVSAKANSTAVSQWGGGKWKAATKPVLALGILAVGLLAAGIAGGAIDREVLLESPRSLRFRLMYWVGTLDLLKDRWLFGTGPGNFRNAYLQHKMPEASEQILDPHNLILDTYASAGLIGCVGLAMLLVSVMRRGADVTDAKSLVEESAERSSQVGRTSGVVIKAAMGAVLIFVSWTWLNGTDLISELMKLPDGQLLVLAIPVCVLAVAIWFPVALRIDRFVFQAAFVTLVVHLMGAGAFQVTAVGLMLVCLHRGGCEERFQETLTASSGREKSATQDSGWSRKTRQLAGVGFAGFAVAVVILGLIPVRSAQRAQAMSLSAESTGHLNLAVAALEDEIEANLFDVKLRQRKAELLTYALMAVVAEQSPNAPVSGKVEELYLEALAACEDWRESDSTGYREFEVKSRLLEAWWKVKGVSDDLAMAVRAMESAVQRYPTSAEGLSRLAILQEKSGMLEESRRTASSALRQDQVNREWGHAELFLSDEIVEQIQKLLK